MTHRLAHLALRLYPLGFQRRYGDELRALVDESPSGPRTVLDLLRGAAVAHLRPGDVAAAVAPDERLRASASGALACWVVFAAAGFGFYKTTEDPAFSAAGTAHPVLGAAHLAVQALAVAATLVIVAGALPLVALALRHARSEPAVRRTVGAALGAVVVFAGLTAGLVALAHGHHATATGHAAFVAWGVAALVCGGVCVVAARRALFAVPVARGRLVAAFACATLLALAMLAITVAAGVYALALTVDASRLGGLPDGPLGAVTTNASLGAQLVVMVLAGTLAAVTTRRGWHAARAG